MKSSGICFRKYNVFPILEQNEKHHLHEVTLNEFLAFGCCCFCLTECMLSPWFYSAALTQERRCVCRRVNFEFLSHL